MKTLIESDTIEEIEVIKEDENNLRDRLGIVASCICAVHCLITPVLAMVWPFIATHGVHEYIHIGLFLLVAPLAFMAFATQRKKHGSNLPFIYGSIGISFLSCGILFHDLAHSHFWLYTILNVIGSSFLVYAHYRNIKLCQCHSCHL